MQLCHWEYVDLEEHLESRTDIWARGEANPNLWVRSFDDGPILGLMVTPPKSSGPFRMYGLSVVPLGEWSSERCDEYLVELVSKWTSYGFRMKATKFLADELHLEGNKAFAVAIGLIYMMNTDFDPDSQEQAVQTTLLGNELPRFDPFQEAPKIPLYYIAGGGYVALSLVSEMLRVSISLHSRDHGGFYTTLDGFVRPKNGNVTEFVKHVLESERIDMRPTHGETEKENEETAPEADGRGDDDSQTEVLG